MELIGKMLAKGYYGAIRASDFKIELFRVIPSFKTDATWQAGKSKIMRADNLLQISELISVKSKTMQRRLKRERQMKLKMILDLRSLSQ